MRKFDKNPKQRKIDKQVLKKTTKQKSARPLLGGRDAAAGDAAARPRPVVALSFVYLKLFSVFFSISF